MYLRSLVDEMDRLMTAIYRHERSLQSGNTNQDYGRLRRIILGFAPIYGSPSDLLKDCETGWDFWEKMENVSKHYSDREVYVREHFYEPYIRVLTAIAGMSLTESLLRRDIILEDKVGDGGFGIVHKATQIVIEAYRAVKVFNPVFYQGEPRPLRRFAREAELLGSMSHPNIVRFYDAGVAGDQPFIITEFIDGCDMNRQIASHGPLQEKQALSVCEQILLALIVAHKRDLIHRDIKPANIMVDRGGVAKLVDFGSGTAINEASLSSLTTGVVGTPGFIDPLLLSDPSIRNPTLDIYSLGVTLHWLLTGNLPYPGDAAYLLNQQNITIPTQQVVLKSLRGMDDRYQSAEEMKIAVSRVLGV